VRGRRKGVYRVVSRVPRGRCMKLKTALDARVETAVRGSVPMNCRVVQRPQVGGHREGLGERRLLLHPPPGALLRLHIIGAIPVARRRDQEGLTAQDIQVTGAIPGSHL